MAHGSRHGVVRHSPILPKATDAPESGEGFGEFDEEDLRVALDGHMHDLNTLMTGVVGYLELAVEESLPSPARHLVAVASNAARDVSRTIRNIEFLNHSGAVPAIYPLMRLMLPTLADEQMRSMASGFDEHGVRLLRHGFCDLTLLANRELLVRLIQNMLFVAGRHAPPGSFVNVRLSEGPLGGLLRVDFPGDPPEDEEVAALLAGVLFPRGRRPALARRGCGLAIAFCKRAADLFGGSFGIDTTAGEGTLRTVLVLRVPQAPSLVADDAPGGDEGTC